MAEKIEEANIVWFGEEAEYAAHQGHVDADEFTAVVDRVLRRDVDPSMELLASFASPAHVWQRPKAEQIHDDGIEYESCKEDDDRAEPWTMIETGA